MIQMLEWQLLFSWLSNNLIIKAELFSCKLAALKLIIFLNSPLLVVFLNVRRVTQMFSLRAFHCFL